MFAHVETHLIKTLNTCHGVFPMVCPPFLMANRSVSGNQRLGLMLNPWSNPCRNEQKNIPKKMPRRTFFEMTVLRLGRRWPTSLRDNRPPDFAEEFRFSRPRFDVEREGRREQDYFFVWENECRTTEKEVGEKVERLGCRMAPSLIEAWSV